VLNCGVRNMGFVTPTPSSNQKDLSKSINCSKEKLWE
jgi:hypothetical protein